MCAKRERRNGLPRCPYGFNLAMLAKQCWRLIVNYGSLWAGVQTFKKGCIWRVGDGAKINIWNDCWIPNSASRKIITVQGNQVLTRVCELIDPISGEWDEQLIRENFWHIDAERILQIPLFHAETEDFVAWQLTKNGVFSVWSAYYKQWEANFDENDLGLVRYSTAPHPIWRKLWSLKVPAKIKIFYGDAYTMLSHASVFTQITI